MAPVLPHVPNSNGTAASYSSSPPSSSTSGHRRLSLASHPSHPSSKRSSSTVSTRAGSVVHTSSNTQATRQSFASTKSSTTSRRSHNAEPSKIRSKQRKAKPQYPASASEKHVEYILVASFDIDRGSIMEHQYPGPISGDEHMLAELMLPDQAHVRSQDWTIFFLHKDVAPGELAAQPGDASGKKTKRGEAATDEEDARSRETHESETLDNDLSDSEDEDGMAGSEEPPL
ncbi:hypothetical protein LTR28_000748, partial [Elasticomyces elasticus]